MPVIGKALFVHIPRTGGTFLERHFLPPFPFEVSDPQLLVTRPFLGGVLDHAGFRFTLHHLTCQEIAKYQFANFADYLTFSIVRDPYTRCISLYRYWKAYFASFNEFLHHLCDINIREYEFNGWCRVQPVWLKTDSPFTLKYHFLPQFMYLTSEHGAIMVEHICRYENYEEDVNRVLAMINYPLVKFDRIRSIETRKADYNVLDEKSRLLVWSLYERDFDVFGYPNRLRKYL